MLIFGTLCCIQVQQLCRLYMPAYLCKFFRDHLVLVLFLVKIFIVQRLSLSASHSQEPAPGLKESGEGITRRGFH